MVHVIRILLLISLYGLSGAEADTETLLPELIEKAHKGDVIAQYELGRRLEYGLGIARSDIKAMKWYKKASSQGCAKADYRLGVLYDNGWGIEENDSLAAKFYVKAARMNHALAQHDLAIMYYEGTGVPKDNILAYKWLYIAVGNGNDTMKEQLRIISLELSTDQIVQAEKLAVDWRKQSMVSESVNAITVQSKVWEN